MANSPQARKRVRIAEKRRQLISPMRAHARTVVKNMIKSLDNKDLAAAKTNFVTVCSTLDRLSRKNIIHKNRVARIKSRLNKRLKALATA